VYTTVHIFEGPQASTFGLAGELSQGGLGPVVPISSGEDVPTDNTSGESRALVAVCAGDGVEVAMTAVHRATRWSTGALVLVVPDHFLGAGVDQLESAEAGGAVVATIRSIAVQRGRHLRANVVVVPGSLLGLPPVEQRGPLRREVTSADVAGTTAFLLSAEARYVNGQVLFVNAGRHLFTSLSA
jgi:hypothetical protein